jgi:hypothetical protein
VEPEVVVESDLTDRDDLTLLAALRLGLAQTLVTGDKALLTLRDRYPIHTTAEFWAVHGGLQTVCCPCTSTLVALSLDKAPGPAVRRRGRSGAGFARHSARTSPTPQRPTARGTGWPRSQPPACPWRRHCLQLQPQVEVENQTGARCH